MLRKPLPYRFRQAPFLVGDAVSAGVPPSRLRASDLIRLTRGLRVPTSVKSDDVDSRCAALSHVLGPDCFFSHGTAAQLWGIAVPSAVENDQVRVTTLHGSRVRRLGITGHRTDDPRGISLLRGLRLSAPFRAWLECSPMLTPHEMIAFGDQLLRWETREDLLQNAAAWRGHPGIRAVRDALEYVRPGSESPKESEVRWVAATAGLPDPLCNVDVFGRDGSFVGRPDMHFPEARLIIEYEGRHHQMDRRTYLSDIARRERFEREGWRMILVTDRDVADHEALRTRLRERFAERMAEMPR